MDRHVGMELFEQQIFCIILAMRLFGFFSQLQQKTRLQHYRVRSMQYYCEKSFPIM